MTPKVIKPYMMKRCIVCNILIKDSTKKKYCESCRKKVKGGSMVKEIKTLEDCQKAVAERKAKRIDRELTELGLPNICEFCNEPPYTTFIKINGRVRRICATCWNKNQDKDEFEL